MSAVTPLEKYEQDMASGHFSRDEAQANAIGLLDDLFNRLIELNKPKGFFKKVADSFLNDKQPEKGLYFWGGVGRGKTYLMDMFYDQLPFENKMRLHFHRFMHQLHEQLKSHSGQTDPLVAATATRH